MGNCPSELTLLDYIENKLYDKERVKVEHHLKFCSDCISALSLAQNIPDKLPEVPEYMIEKAKKIPFERG